MIVRARRLERWATVATAVVALQAMAAVFFVIDLAGDVAGDGWGMHLAIEAIAAIALLAAVVMGALQIRLLLGAARQDETAVALAKGVVGDLAQLRFKQWHLTPAEADVALFALKGCDIAEIAALRGAAAGTVRAQLARVYAKAGVTSHVALVAQFVEELLDRPASASAVAEGGE